MLTNIPPTMPFPDAANRWLSRHKDDIKPKTLEGYTYYIGTLRKAFGSKLLSQITAEDVLNYQHERKKEVSAGLVNHELNCLKQIMDAADLWHGIAKHYTQLKQTHWTRPKVLTPEDEERFFITAASKPEWQYVMWACTLANNTSAIGQELCNLQLQHVFLEHQPPKIHINDSKVKNEYRARVIPLNPAAFDAMTNLVARAKKLGACGPNHYVFPFRVARNQFDVSRPASPSFIRGTFHKIRQAAGLPWLQPRNFRNQVITKLFESGAPDETIMSIAGHSSIRMSRFYSKIRIESKADALNHLAPAEEKKPARSIAFDLAGKADAAIGMSIAALVDRLKGVGLSAEKILEVVSGVRQ
jgi:site-specific recombinase XerD